MDSIYTLQSFLAAWFVTAWLVIAGMVTQAVVSVRVAWVMRCGGALLFFSPVLLAGAFEVFWMLVCSVALGSLLIAGLQKAGCVRPEAGPGGSGAQEAATLKYTIGTILCFTALSAGAIALAMQTPALNLRAWVSLLLFAVASSCISAGVYSVTQAEKLTTIRIAVVGLGIGLLTVLVSYFDWLLLSFHIETSWPPDVTSFTWGIPGVPVPTLHPEWLWFGVSALSTACLFLWSLSWSAWRSRWRARKSAGVITAGGVLALVAPPLVLSLMLLHVQDLPERAQEENAYPQVAAIAARIQHSEFENTFVRSFDLESLTQAELSKILFEIEADLDELLQQLRRPMASPIDFTIDALRVDDVTNFRMVARALVARGRLRSGQRSAAVDCLSAVQLGVRTRNGGLLVQYLSGLAFSSVGLAELYVQRAAFDAPTREFVSQELLAIANEIEPLESVLETERIWMINQGWHQHLTVLLSECAGESVVGVEVETLERLALQERTEISLLATEMALQNYQSRYGVPPDSLQRLVPELLPQVPPDLFAKDGRPLNYQRRSGGYVLYSVGVDGIDDNGTITELQPGVLPLSGDLSLNGIFGSSEPQR